MKVSEAYTQIHLRSADFAARFLTRAKDGKSFVCPRCRSGSKKNGTGMTLTETGDHAGKFKCWACNFAGDAEDVYREIKGLPDTDEGKAEARREICSALGIMLDEAPKKKPEEMTDEEKQAEEVRLIHADISNAQLNTNDPAFIEYLGRRRIPLEVARRFKVGFLPLWTHPKTRINGQKVKPSPRLIIPTGKSSYLARDTRKDVTPEEAKYSKSKAGNANIFNVAALSSDRPIFICEGEIDALSFYAVDAEAIGIGGTSGRAELIAAIQKRGKRHLEPLILALDNDEPGRKATEELAAELDGLGIRYYIRNPYGTHKDANEALVSDREAFLSEVKSAEAAEFEECSNLAWLEYLKKTNENPPPLVQTGFSQLDTLLGGGIKGDELVFFGGVSSSGKSAFCLQMVDQMARNGQKVLIFSAEMSRRSIINRSLSRETAEGEGWKYTASEVGGYGINKNDKYREAMSAAYDRYAKYAGNIVIFDTAGGSEGMKPHAIEARIKRYLKVNRGEKPLVFIDYLQILPTESNKGDIRASINDAIDIFSSIAHGLQVPIIMISSLSRDNYTVPLNLAAFKESGNIEYGADIVLGLQFEAIHYDPFTSNEKGAMPAKWAKLAEEKHRNPRKVEVALIKRRDEKGEGRVLFDYDPRHNHFTQNEPDADFLTANYGDDTDGKGRANEMLTGHKYSRADLPKLTGFSYQREAITKKGHD